MSPAPPGWLTLADVAEQRSVTLSTARRWCALGWLEGAVKAGPRLWLVPVDALEGFEPPKPGPKPRRSDGEP